MIVCEIWMVARVFQMTDSIGIIAQKMPEKIRLTVVGSLSMVDLISTQDLVFFTTI